MKTAILLASYRGEAYLDAQLRSLCRQTERDFVVYLRDDGSDDRTVEIEERYAAAEPERFIALRRTEGKGGSKYNFLALCAAALLSDADYFMFCDQDDVWDPDKVEITLARMREAEGGDPSVPVLVHTDLRVVDQDLNLLGDSFMAYRALNPACTQLNRLLVQNNVTGCTMMVNRALLELAMRYRNVEAIAMHDWWFALVASAFGKIAFVERATIQYRQHGGNVIGATKVNSLSFILKRLTGSAHVRETLQMSVDQAAEFLECYGSLLSEEQRAPLAALAGIQKKHKPGRIAALLKHDLLKQGFVQVVGELLFI